ncbi:MAG: FkbM family methyltransferase [Candidatus Bathyarchaeia archaeon]|jgi:FkbM family methyltransferase
MVTLSGLAGTLSVAKNPHTALALKLTKKRKKITFANGSEFRLTWQQFRFLRDHYKLVEKYNLQQIDDETFKIHTDRFQFVGSLILMCLVDEMESGIYDYDYRGKVVLDIGGFEGDSAVYFWGMGAKKVIIYEPVLAHIKFIKENVLLNKVNAEIHEEGIGKEDGEITIAYDQADNCFGLERKGLPNKMNIKIRDISKVIAESDAEVAKIDCEGAEISLVNVPKEILRRLEYVIIEVHTPQIRQVLIQKFKDSGFILAKGNEENDQQISIICLKRIQTTSISHNVFQN